MSTALRFEVEGSVGGPALLLLHGILSSNLQWAPNLAGLGRSLRLVRVEHWGHGGSPAPEDPSRYDVAALVAELDRIRESLGLPRWFVCGQSFGAGLAIRYALAHPDRVAGLVVTNSRSALNDVLAEEGTEGSGTTTRWEELDLRRLPYHPCHARRFPAELKARMESAADAVSKDALGLLTTRTLPGLCCRSDLGSIAVPTLLVNGRFEKRFQPDRDFAAQAIPQVAIADLDGGHSVNVEAAAGFDAAVLEFVGRVGQRPSGIGPA